MENLTFSEALEALKRGQRVARKRWPGSYLKLDESVITVTYTGQSTKWPIHQEDILAEDWLIPEEEQEKSENQEENPGTEKESDPEMTEPEENE